MIDECLAQGVTPASVLLSVGGGGLLCGVAQGLQQNALPLVPILATETEGAASMHAALRAGQPVALEMVQTCASSLGARQVCPQVLTVSNQQTLVPVLAQDDQTLAACRWLLDTHQLLVEPACGAALAPLVCPTPEQAKHVDALPHGPVVVIICGGVGLDAQTLLKIDA